MVLPIAVRFLFCCGGRQLLFGAADGTRKLLQLLHRLQNTNKCETGYEKVARIKQRLQNEIREYNKRRHYWPSSRLFRTKNCHAENTQHKQGHKKCPLCTSSLRSPCSDFRFIYLRRRCSRGETISLKALSSCSWIKREKMNVNEHTLSCCVEFDIFIHHKATQQFKEKNVQCANIRAQWSTMRTRY